ncbi:M16 family metallopeptidase [Paracoccaceae bacterium GXU_MW_L88]
MTQKITTLDNGLRIVTEHQPSLASATLGVWVEAGGRHERPEENGIAHFLEHMAFKGTARRSARQIAETIEDVGGYINAYTSKEITAYYARVLGEDVPLALDVIGDILTGSTLEPKEIESERGVILSEIGQSLDTPDDIIFDWLQETAYPEQAFGRTILGPAERVSGFSREDLSGFVSTHYHPERMILSAAGAVDHDKIVKDAERLFGGMARADRGGPELAHFEGGERRERKKLEQAHVTLAFESPGYRDADLYTAQIYTTLMGGGMSSRLFQALREERGLCYTIFAQAGAHEDTGMLTLYAGTGEKDLPELLNATMDELRRAPGEITEEEVARARAQLKAGLVMGLESPSARAERQARMLSIWGRIPAIEETVAKIDAVDLASIRRFAGSLAERKAAMALYGPIGDAPMLSDLKGQLAA